MRYKMKKAFSFIILLFLGASILSACAFEDVKIEDYTWELSLAFYVENEEVVVCATDASGSDLHPDAAVVDATLTARDGILTVTDHTNNCSYQGTYRLTQIHPRGRDYEITLDGKTGHATVAMTTYADGTQTPTLPISLGKHSLQFFAEP